MHDTLKTLNYGMVLVTLVYYVCWSEFMVCVYGLNMMMMLLNKNKLWPR